MTIKAPLRVIDNNCPVSGLPIVSKTEWENIQLTKDYSATFQLIGDNILLSKPIGESGIEGLDRFFFTRKKILHEVGLIGKPYFEIKDYSGISVIPDRKARSHYINLLMKEEEDLVAIIGFNCNLIIQLIGKIGKATFGRSTKIAAFFMTDYKKAMTRLLELMQQTKVQHSQTPKNRVIHKDWYFSSDTVNVSVEVYNRNILYSKIESPNRNNRITREDIDKYFQTVENVVQHIYQTTNSKDYFRVLDIYLGRHSYISGRKLFFSGLKKLNEKYPSVFSILIGSDLTGTMVGYLSSLYLSYKIIRVGDLNKSLRIIEEYKNKKNIEINQNYEDLTNQFKQSASPKQINDVLQFLGDIIWEKSGDIPISKIPEQHPLKQVFEAISIVKVDIDNLMDERSEREAKLSEANKQLAQLHTQLKEANEALEERVRLRTLELEKANIDLIKSQKEVEKLNQQLSHQVTKKTSQLHVAQEAILETEHKSEIADVTTGTLHNVKNILNSIKVSAGYVARVNSGSAISGFRRANEMLNENMDTLKAFICDNPKGKTLMHYYLKLENAFDQEIKESDEQLTRLKNKIEIVERIVNTQQEYGHLRDFEYTDVNQVISDAVLVKTDAISSHNITVTEDFSCIPKIKTLKNKLLHVFINIIKNAQDALEVNTIDNRNLIFQTNADNQFITVKITDNGIGIRPDKIHQMFQYGFTTKLDGHGYGLSSSKAYIEEMGGFISVESNGVNQGSAFIIKLPIGDTKTKDKSDQTV